MGTVTCDLEELLLDLENPRISKSDSQRGALQKIIEDQDVKLVVLADSIVSDGLNPMDRWLVIKSAAERGRYVVLEGNRRLAALRILNNPRVLNDLEVRAPVKRRLQTIANEFDLNTIEPIDCFEVSDRAEAATWLNQRHTGENKGRGIVDWGGVATARFRGRDPALQALDLVVNHGGLTAGGAGIALELLFHEYVSHVHINDLSRPIYSFWKSVLSNTEQLCKLIRDTPLTLHSWDRQKKIFANQRDHDQLTVGFSAFFLNRTNRSGIFNGGVIGGRDQNGSWKIDARFNRLELIGRIEAIAKMRRRISLTRMDAINFLTATTPKLGNKSLTYLDPPYFTKGRDLYYDFYEADDHLAVRNFVTKNLRQHKWIVSYDNVPTIRTLYSGYQQVVYGIGYSAREVREGSEIMFFSDTLNMPTLIGPFRLIRRVAANSKLRYRRKLGSKESVRRSLKLAHQRMR